VASGLALDLGGYAENAVERVELTVA